MKDFSKIMVLLFVFCLLLGSSCKNTADPKNSNGFEIEFDVLDKKSNSLDVRIMLSYRLSSGQLEKILKQYGQDYKDKLLIPNLKSICRDLLIEYPAGDIYNYKRQVIEEDIVNQTRLAFQKYDIELTKLLLTSVKLPEALKKRLKKEHVKRMNEQNK